MQLQQHTRLEIITYKEKGDYLEVQVALGGVLAPSMDIHKSAREEYRTEQAWTEYLKRCAESLIKCYGDARHPRHIHPRDLEASLAVAV